MEETTLGGDPETGQDVTIILVPPGKVLHDQTLALIHLHSQILTRHSGYFDTCLSDRWKLSSPPSATSTSTSTSAAAEFFLEVQTDVRHYLECFATMYSPSPRISFEGVKQAIELLRVASQIEYTELMSRISLYLSCLQWTDQDEIRVREYATSPDFSRLHLEDLVLRLGLDESDDDRQAHVGELIRQCTRAALKASILEGVELPGFLRGIGHYPLSGYSATVVEIVSQVAKGFFAQIGKEWGESTPSAHSYITKTRIQTMCWILEALLDGQVGEELVQSVVHIDAIPNCIVSLKRVDGHEVYKQKLAELVLVIFQEVVAGRLLLRPAEKFALLANWHVMMKTWLSNGSFEQATTNLFLTLPVQQQTELIKLRLDKVYDYIGTMPLVSLVSKHSVS